MTKCEICKLEDSVRYTLEFAEAEDPFRQIHLCSIECLYDYVSVLNGTKFPHPGGGFSDKPWFFLNEYVLDKRYGGPEEGGWWYDVGTFTHCWGYYRNNDEADRVRQKYKSRIDEKNDGRPDISSVLSRGRYQILIETSPGADFPSYRPVYS